MPWDDSESSGGHLPRLLTLLGVACLIGAVAGGGIKAFGIEIPAVGSTPRQLLLGFIGVGLIASGLVIGRKYKDVVAVAGQRSLTPAERQQVRMHTALVAKSLRQLLQQPDEHEFLIVEVEGLQGFYVQFLENDSVLWAEMVAPNFLKPVHRLRREQVKLIRSYDWQPPNKEIPNFHKQFAGTDDDSVLDVAREVIDLLLNAYHVSPDEPLRVRFGDQPRQL